MNRTVRRQIVRRGSVSSARAGHAGVGVAALLLLTSGTALGDQVIWVARAANNRIFFNEPFSTTPSLGGYFDVNYSPDSSQNVFKNLMFPNTPGSSAGTFPQATTLSTTRMTDLVIGNDLHPDRTVSLTTLPGVTEFFEFENDLYSLRLTTQGNVNIVDNESFSDCWDRSEGWLVRDPQSSGVHLLRVDRFRFGNVWVGGSGHLQLEAWRPTLMTAFSTIPVVPMVKMGPGTMVYNPSYSAPRWPASQSAMIVRDGTLALAGPGIPYLFTDQVDELLKIGAQYGGQDYPPDTVPPASWSPFPIPQLPPVKSPRVVIQADNVIPPGKIVRMGFNSVLRFEAPEPISFLGSVVSDSSGLASTRIECRAELLEAVSFNIASLSQFRGTFQVERGIARIQGAPDVAAAFVLAAPTYPYEAVLELRVPGGQYGFSNPISGMGRVIKSGAEALFLSSDTTGFNGDFVINAGHLVLPASAPAGTLRNAVSVDGPTSVLNQQASEAVADNTAVSLDNSGRWLLNGRTDTISRLKLVDNARVELGGGTLTLGGGVLEVVHTPGGTTTATVAGPGTLAGTVPLAVDSVGALAPIDLDIQATLAAPSVLFTGSGTVRLAGSGAAGPAVTVQGGVLRLARTGVNAATGAVTIGDAGSGLPSAPDAAVVLDASDQFPDNKPVTLNVRGLLDLNGFSDTIGGLAVNGAGPFAVGAEGGELGLAGAASFTGTGVTSVYGPLNLLGGSRSWTINAGSTVVMTGAVNSGTLSKLGPGPLFLDNVNGSFTLNNSGATTSATRTSVGGVAGSGTIFLDTSLTIDTPAATQRGYGGAFAGAGALIKTGPGTQELNAGAANTHTGGTRVEGGTLFLNRFPGTTVVPGGLAVADGGTLLYALGADNQIADATDVIVDVGGVVRMDGQRETVRNITLSGDWSVDRADGTPGDLRVTQSVFVLGGALSGNMSGGAVTLINDGVGDLRGTVASMNVAGNGRLAVGGKAGSDQLTITGNFTMFNSTSRVTFTPGAATDPALIRALGTLTYPSSGQVQVRVNQFTPYPAGTSIRLIDFGTGTSTPDLSRYALIAPLNGSGRGRLALSGRVLSYVVARNPCPADADGSGTLTVADIFAFLSQWFAGSAGGDFDLSGGREVSDIFAFLSSWFAGC